MKGGNLPFLQGHASVVHKDLIFIFGGTFSNGIVDTQLWTFNTDSGHLHEVSVKPGRPQPSCRHDHSAIVHNSVMYIYGGFVNSRGANHELWAFNIDDEEWKELTTLSRAQPGRRYGHSAVVAENAMWLFGGMAGLNPKSDLWRYSFLLHQWKRVKGLGSPPCLSGHTASVVHHHMIIIGGKSQGRLISDVWCYNFDANSWIQLAGSGVMLPCLSQHACVLYLPSDLGNKEPKSLPHPSPHLKHSWKHKLPHDHFRVRHKSSTSLNKKKIELYWVHSATETQKITSADHIGKEVVLTSDSERDLTNNIGINCSDAEDKGIHVSMKEALIPSSPVTPSPYNWYVPISWKDSGYTKLQEEVCDEETPHDRGCSAFTLNPSENSSRDLCQQMLSFHNSEEFITDPGGFSDSHVLEVSSCLKSANSEMEKPSRDALFLEDMEMERLGGLDELHISYPSKKSFLPSSLLSPNQPAAGMPHVNILSMQQGHYFWQSHAVDNKWHQQQQHQSSHLMIESDPVLSSKDYGADAKVQPNLNMKSLPNGNDQDTPDRLQDEQHQDCPHQTLSLEKQSLCQSLQIMDRVFHDSLISVPVKGACQVEAETSFIETDDLLMQNDLVLNTWADTSHRTDIDVGACSVPSVVGPLSGEMYLKILDKEVESEPIFEKDQNKAEDTCPLLKKCESKGACNPAFTIEKYASDSVEVSAGERAEPFLLVLGGSSEGVSTKPLSVLKGVLL